jgi:ABC-type phosphate transport system substrate-binding protein
MTSASPRIQIRQTFAMLALAGGVTLLAGIQPAHAARDYVWAAGSSTTFPFATRVSEQFARKTGMKAPKVGMKPATVRPSRIVSCARRRAKYPPGVRPW